MVVADPYPKMVIPDRSLNRRTSDYTHAQIPYIKRLAFSHFLRSLHFFRVAIVTNPLFVCVCVIFISDCALLNIFIMF